MGGPERLLDAVDEGRYIGKGETGVVVDVADACVECPFKDELNKEIDIKGSQYAVFVKVATGVCEIPPNRVGHVNID